MPKCLQKLTLKTKRTKKEEINLDKSKKVKLQNNPGEYSLVIFLTHLPDTIEQWFLAIYARRTTKIIK